MSPTNMVIVNAYPKGDDSLTPQCARYLLTHEPNVEWSVVHVGEKLTSMGCDTEWFDEACTAIERCDAIIGAAPVSIMLVPCQLVRLFDFVGKAGKSAMSTGTYATSVMSCFHYFDHLAQDWLQGTCEDLGMPFFEGFNVDTKDLVNAEFRPSMRTFTLDDTDEPYTGSFEELPEGGGLQPDRRLSRRER